MPSVPSTSSTAAPTGAVSRWVGLLRDWMHARKYGSHEDRKADMLAAMQTLEGGPALLQHGQEVGVDLQVRHSRFMKSAFGYARPSGEGKGFEVAITNNGDPVGMALTAQHEYRHVAQMSDGKGDVAADPYRVSMARAVFIQKMMQEADACTIETLAAAKQNTAGNPAYLQDIQKRTTPAYRCIQRFLKDKPHDSFKSDAAFCRSLFTEIMLDGLEHYKYGFLMGQSMAFRAGDTLEKFKDLTADKGAIAQPTQIDALLSDAYGPQFMTLTSTKALQTAFFETLPARERDVLSQMERTALKAVKGKLDAEGFTAARTEILAKVTEIYFTEDEEAAMIRWSLEKDPKRIALRQAAVEDKPVSLRQIVKPSL